VSDQKDEKDVKLQVVKDDKQILLEKDNKQDLIINSLHQKTFIQEMMIPSVTMVNISIFTFFTSFKLVQEWAIKFCQAKGLSWDEGA